MKEEELAITVGEETEQPPTGELLVVSPRVSVVSSKMGQMRH